MQEAEYNYQDFHKPRQGDEKLAIRFFVKARQDGEETQKQGRPIFKEHEYIQIMTPGDRSNVLVRPVTDPDRGRFSQQYQHWKNTRQSELTIGTPLEAWNILNLAQIEEYRYFGIRTIEHLAELRDDVAGKIPGATGLKQKAQQFLALSKEEAPMKRFQSELDKRDNELATLKTALEDQAKLIKDLQQGRTLEVPKAVKRPRA